MIDPKIESYCLNASSRPSVVCEEIFENTQKNHPMAVMLTGPIQMSLIGFWLEATRAKRVLEIGCFTGYSALAMAERLPDGGELITLDIDPETMATARSFWNKSPHGKKIKSVVGPAAESLAQINGPFDFVYIDADKENYPTYFKMALERLSPQGVIGLDNSLRDGEVLKDSPSDEGYRVIKKLTAEIVANPHFKTCLVPVRDGLLLVQKTKA